MARKDKLSLRRLTVTLRHISSPDADMRLSRVIDILLESATRKQNPPAAGSQKYHKAKTRAHIADDVGFGVRK